jgi:hypothetical protein
MKNLIKKIIQKRKPVTLIVDEVDDITDEIEIALARIKDDLDLPTEEVEKAIVSRRILKKKRV